MSAAFLVARDLTKSYGARVVVDGVSLTAGAGRRIGLVGDNGTGKTTLLRLLAGLDDPDAGEVVRPDDVGFLHQELPYPHGSTVTTVLEDSLAEVRRVERELAEVAERLAVWPGDAGLLATYGDLLEWARVHEVWDADRRVDLVLAGLGLSGVGGDRTLDALSGGQRCRLGLAALLVRQPRVVVLDEPTNHLDDAAVTFLQRHLAALPGAVVLASHDRVFLDAVCTDIVDMDPGVDGVTHYGGAFSDYLWAKRVARARWEQRRAVEQDELARLRESVAVTARQVSHGAPRGNTSKLAYDYKGARVDKQISRRVRDARQRLDELERTQMRKPPVPLRFAAPVTSGGAGDEVAVRVRAAGLGSRVWLDELDLDGDGRLLITGPNGAGKSSLLYLMAGGCVRRPVWSSTGGVCGSGCWSRTWSSPMPTARLGRCMPLPPGAGVMSRGWVSWGCWPGVIWIVRSVCSRSVSVEGWRWPRSSPIRRTCCCWTSRPITSR